VCIVFQKLDVSGNRMTSISSDLSVLKNLKELNLNDNHMSEIPVDVLKCLTAPTFIDLSIQFGPVHKPLAPGEELPVLKIPSSLLPILHPGLLKLDLQQRLSWDPLSQAHLGCALAAVADRVPPLTLLV
jgi:Leucine-rich repeat (LRR) protein